MDTLIVLETDVLIDHFRCIAEATAAMRSLPMAQRATIEVTVMELSKGASGPQERSTIARCLPRPRFTGLSMSDAASHHAVPIGVPQALIRLH
jgi:predicted nucleic acid-binding protein